METRTIWDKNGNRIGEDVITTDRDGLLHITHYDTAHNCIGRSDQTRDYRGEIYVIHEDASGHILARSTLERDWWGEHYVKTEETAWAGAQRRDEAGRHSRRGDGGTEPDAGDTGDILHGIVIPLVKAFAFLLLGVFLCGLMIMSGATIWLFLLIPVLNESSNLSQIGPAVIVLSGLIMLSYFVYVGILLCRRRKKEITWKDLLLAVLRWAIIGPFAYRWVLARKKRKFHPEYDPHRPYELPVWQCPNCGKGIFNSGRFCPECGTENPERSAFFTVLCPHCSKPIQILMGQEMRGVCRECGHPYDFEQR